MRLACGGEGLEDCQSNVLQCKKSTYHFRLVSLDVTEVITETFVQMLCDLGVQASTMFHFAQKCCCDTSLKDNSMHADIQYLLAYYLAWVYFELQAGNWSIWKETDLRLKDFIDYPRGVVTIILKLLL